MAYKYPHHHGGQPDLPSAWLHPGHLLNGTVKPLSHTAAAELLAAAEGGSQKSPELSLSPARRAVAVIKAQHSICSERPEELAETGKGDKESQG